MKKVMKVLSSALMAAALLLSLSVPAYAAESVITYSGKETGFGFQPGSEYTGTDLFDNFKDVLPGDSREESITFRNSAKDCDYVKLYMRAAAHDETANPLSPGVAQTGETVATMSDFLSQLTMRVYHGTELIYEASPDELDGLAGNVYLGTIRRGKTTDLRVALSVPVELNNAYAERAGEVDWIFTVETFDDPPLIQTGQLNWPIPVLFSLGAAMLLLGLYLMLKKGKKEYA